MRIVMRHGVFGEDGQEWHPGEEHEASHAFGVWLIQRKKAMRAPESRAPEPVAIDKGGDPVSTAPAVERKPSVPKRGTKTRKR